MFVNIGDIKRITGIDVANEVIVRAQEIIESYTGRLEETVYDNGDITLMGRAIAFQAVYMRDNYDKVYEQVATTGQTQLDGQASFDRDLLAPFLAPLAVITLRNVSWKKSRSVHTGPIFSRSRHVGWSYS